MSNEVDLFNSFREPNTLCSKNGYISNVYPISCNKSSTKMVNKTSILQKKDVFKIVFNI